MTVQETIIARIKQKKELQGVDDAAVSSLLVNAIRRHQAQIEKLNERQKKVLIKEVRAELRRMVGRFSSPNFSKKLDKKINGTLLSLHASTRERKEMYHYIRQMLAIHPIHSILDLGCGLNPIALASPGRKYYAADINNQVLDEVRKFFEKEGIDGRAWVLDLRTALPGDFPPADICLLLKVFDVLEKRGHKRAEALMKMIPCSNLLVSFPTHTLSGKPMNHPQRGWFERLTHRLGYSISREVHGNEIFYFVIKAERVIP